MEKDTKIDHIIKTVNIIKEFPQYEIEDLKMYTDKELDELLNKLLEISNKLGKITLENVMILLKDIIKK